MNYSLALQLASRNLINKNMKDFLNYQLKGIRVSQEKIAEAEEREPEPTTSFRHVTIETLNGGYLNIKSGDDYCDFYYNDDKVGEDIEYSLEDGTEQVEGYVEIVTSDGGRLIIEKENDSSPEVSYYDRKAVAYLEEDWRKNGILNSKIYEKGLFEDLGLEPDKSCTLDDENQFNFLDLCQMAINDKKRLEKQIKHQLKTPTR